MEGMVDLRAMSPREMGRGLMRGDPAKFKQGYTAENATKAVAEFKGLNDAQTEGLRKYLLAYEARGGD